MVKNWAFIYASPGYNPQENTTIINHQKTKVTFIGVDPSQKDFCVNIAKELVKNGCEMIELCGAFGPLYIAKIKEATDYKIPVGGVMYGPEDRGPMLEITRVE